MSKLAVSTIAAMMIGLSWPASAQVPTASEDSMQQALFVARNVGVFGINQVQFYDGKWHVQGRDPGGQNIKVDVDPETGAVLYVDRWW